MNRPVGDALARLWAVLGQRERRSVMLLFVYAVLSSLAELGLLATVVPFALALSSHGAADGLVPGGALSIEKAGLVFLLAIAVASAMRLILLRRQVAATRTIAEYLCIRSYDRTLNRPYIEHAGTNSSQIIASLTGRLDIVFQSIIISATSGLSQLVMSVSIIVALVLTSVWVTAIILASVVTAYGLFVYRARGTVRRQSQRHNDAVSAVTRILAESLVGIRDVLLSGGQSRWLVAYRAQQHVLRDANAQLSVIAATPRIVVEALGFAVIVAVACILAATTTSATTPISILAVVILGSQRLLPVAQGLYVSWNNLNSGLPHLYEVLPLLERPAVVPADAQPLVLRERLELQGLHYAYPGTARPVVVDAHLTIAAGSVVGIIGRTGSGKSTLLDLVMGLLVADAGDMRVDGMLLSPSDLPRWQRAITHVAQTIHLADATIAENIAMGSPDEPVDQAAVRHAAERAQIAAFIDDLPLGYDTQVGERGVRLSGGQRQRIGIARALYRGGDVLVLDEGTSALDGETERAVMHALGDAAKTIVIVTHRISTLHACDAIYRMTDGGLKGPIAYADLETGAACSDARVIPVAQPAP